MKRNIMSIGVILAAIFTLSACVEDLDNVQVDDAAGVQFEVSAGIVDTKTANDGLKTSWVAGDAISVFHAEADASAYVSDASFTVAEGDLEAGTFKGTLASALDASKSYDWYAVYPYVADSSSPKAAKVTVGNVAQAGDNTTAHLAGVNFPMWGVDSSVEAAARPTLAMTHLSSILEVVVTNRSTSEVTVNTVAFTAPEEVAGEFTVDLTSENPAFTAVQDKSSKTSTLDVTGAAALTTGGSAKYYLSVKPFTAAAGSELVVSVNGIERKVTVASDVVFAPGHIRTLNFDYDQVAAPVVTTDKVAFSSATLNWTTDGLATAFNIYVGGEKKATVGADVLTYDLTGLPTGAESKVTVEAVGDQNTAMSDEVAVKTAGVYEVENNTGTSFLCIGWDELARTEVNGATQAYQVQVYTDADMGELVYDITPYTGGNNGDNYIFGNSSYLGKSSSPQGTLGIKNENVITPMRLSVGGFYPATTYYVRVRTLAGYTNKGTDAKTIAHPFGDSSWSDLVPMTTDAEHVLADDEIIYGGFNDMCVQTDFLSPALGAINDDKATPIAWDKRTSSFLRFYAWGTGLHQANTFGLAATSGITRIDGSTKPVSADCAIHRGNAKGSGNTYIGDMEGWVWAAWTRPMMGAFALDGNTTFIATPPLTTDKLSAEGTECTLTFSAAIRTRYQDNISLTADGLQVQVWRANRETPSYETIHTFKVSEIMPYDVATATAKDVVNDYNRNHLSCDLTLYPGDNVEIVAKRSGYIVLDDILVKRK